MARNLELKMAILRSGLTQLDIVDKSRVDRLTEPRISKIVCGRGEATEPERAELARILGSTVAELFTEDAERVTA